MDNKNDIIDLRSDTVTLPTAAMRSAMAQAEVGDDVYGEDRTVNRLQAMAAEMMGMEAALFVPSGTMGNLVAILAHCGRGDEVILGNHAHTFLFEAGGISALGGVHTYTVPNQPDGTLRLVDIEGAIREKGDSHYPRTQLITLENTHNRCGGVPITKAYTQDVEKLAQEKGLKLHLDGARIFNAAIALDVPLDELVAPVDSVTFCLSKGLCAPIGSIVCGSVSFIASAHRMRKQLGGGMRQVGVIAAAGIVALESMVDRLVEDHARAQKLADGLVKLDGLKVENKSPHTNMVFISLAEGLDMDTAQFAEALGHFGVKVGKAGKRRLRLVTHYWIRDDDVERAVEACSRVLDRVAKGV